MKKVLLILLAVFFSSSAAFAVDFWNAVDEFNPVPGDQDPNAVWTYRQGGTWNAPATPPEGTLWAYKANTDVGVPGYGNLGLNEFIADPKNGWGGCGSDEFAAWTPMVRWLSPVAGKVRVEISARQQDAAGSRPHRGYLLKNDVEIVNIGPLQGNGVNMFIDEVVDVGIGDRVDFKIIIDPPGTLPYYVIFKELISLASDPNSPKTLTMVTEPSFVDSVSPPVGANIYGAHSVVQLEATRYNPCPEVYAFDHWEGNVADPDVPITTITMHQDETVTAVFLDVKVCGDECHPIIPADVDENCKVDLQDFAEVAQSWLTCTHPDCD